MSIIIYYRFIIIEVVYEWRVNTLENVRRREDVPPIDR